MANAALQVSTEAYDASRPRPMGRHAAGEGFLRGFLSYADVDQFVFRGDPSGTERNAFDALVDRLGRPQPPLSWISRADPAALTAVGALHLPTPELAAEAFVRRATGGHGWSLTGVTHTIAETHIMREIGDLLLAPLEPWDALICTSQAVRNAVQSLLEGVADYLRERLEAASIAPAQLVTIPLGTHSDDFQTDPATRRAWRERLDVPHDAPAALHLGRLSVATKLHPGPTALALQESARRLNRTVYWIIFGAGRDEAEEEAFVALARVLAPDVQIRRAPDATPQTRNAVLSAADVFVSLSDNVQETFGLAPLEAMAAGLPCVVSDWDGYRDTVRDGVDGVRVRTIAPRPSLGGDLAHAYASRFIGYDTYARATALFAAVDVGGAADALTTLFDDPGLRARMGSAGAARVREVFDWRVVVPQYQALWRELARRRAAAPNQTPREHPYAPDPFRMFAAWPTAPLTAGTIVSLARPVGPGEIAAWLETPGLRHPAARLPTASEIEALARRLAQGPATVGDLLAATSPDRRAFLERGLVWLAKFGMLRLGGAASRT